MNEHELFKRFRQIDAIFSELTQGLGQVDGVVGGMVTDYQRTRKEWMTHAIQSQAINTLRFYCSWINVIPIIGPLVSLFIMRDSNVQKMSKKILKETIAFQEAQQKALQEEQQQRQVERKVAYMKLREPYTIPCRGARGKRKEDIITEYKIYVAKGEGEQAPPVGNDEEGFATAELLATVKANGEDDEYYWSNWEPGYQYRIWVIGNTRNGDLERQLRGHSSIYQFPTGGELLQKNEERIAQEALLEAQAKKVKVDKARAEELGVAVEELPRAEEELKKKESEPEHQMELKRGNGDKPIDYERKVAQIQSPTRGKDEET